MSKENAALCVQAYDVLRRMLLRKYIVHGIIAQEGKFKFFNEAPHSTFAEAQEIAKHLELARQGKDRLIGVTTGAASYAEKHASIVRAREEKQARKEETDRLAAAARRGKADGPWAKGADAGKDGKKGFDAGKKGKHGDGFDFGWHGKGPKGQKW